MPKTSRQNKQHSSIRRSSEGNVLILVCFGSLLAAAVLLIGFSFSGVFFINNRLQSSADEIALAGAKRLNDRDRSGQANNMIARNRQLVHASREALDETTKNYPELEPFAKQLLNESRDSSGLLEQQRQYLIKLTEQEAQDAVMQKYDEIKQTYKMTLPWIKVDEPIFVEHSLGNVVDVESNVEEMPSFPELVSQDRGRNLVVLSPALNLYKAETDHKLQGPDSDLTFKLSSLPAAVKNSVSPARMVALQSVVPAVQGHLPSVVRVKLTVRVETAIGERADSVISASGAALTTGACPQL